MEKQKTKIEIWEIVLKNYNIPHKTYGGLFCIIRRRGLITWGEWYYLHDIMNKYKFKMPYFDWNKTIIKQFVRKLKKDEKK